MANTFSFDTKLNNYSKIALSLSGGIDSGLLLYYLIRAGYDVTCYTFVRNNNETVTSAAKNIVNFITKTLQSNYVREKPFKIKDHVFVSFSGELITSKRQAMNETYINLINSRVIDCVVSGTTPIEFSSSMVGATKLMVISLASSISKPSKILESHSAAMP